MHKVTHSLLAGVAGGIAGTVAMDFVNALWTSARRRPRPAEESFFHQGGRPDVEKAKQAGYSSGDRGAIATGELAARITEPVLGRSLTPAERHRGGQIAHYAYGALLGASYGLAAPHVPALRAGFGTMYGLSAWIAGVALALPKLGLMQPPWKFTLNQHVFGAASHLVYGSVLECTRFCLDPLRDENAFQ
jgi:hypothetical protein